MIQLLAMGNGFHSRIGQVASILRFILMNITSCISYEILNSVVNSHARTYIEVNIKPTTAVYYINKPRTNTYTVQTHCKDI